LRQHLGRGHAGFDFPVCKGVAQPVGVIALFGQQHFGGSDGSQQRDVTGVVADLTG
jgi:hypothetical protein